MRPLEGVRELRERRMLSQQELADRAGVSLFTVQRIERGEGNVRPKTGRAIAAALGVPVEELGPKAQPPLFQPPGQWGGGARYEEPPPPEEGGPERRYFRPGERLRIHTVPATEWLRPRLHQIERGEKSADEVMRELEEYVAAH